jgi:hypothetical protein
LLFGSCFPHDLAAVQRLFLARWLSSGAIRQQIVDREWPGMRRVRIQCGDHRRPFLDDANSGVAMTMNPTLVTLGQAKPSLKIEVVFEFFKRVLADEKAREEANHHLGHALANRVISLLEFLSQLFEFLLAIRAILRSRFEGRSDLLDILDVFSDFLLLGLDCVQTAVDAAGQPAELLLFEAPFFSSRFRWIDSRTSFKASAIRRPGGWRGPP